VKIKKNVKQKVFVINFLCNTLQIMFIEHLEQKTMRTNMKKKFFPVFPKIMGKRVKKRRQIVLGSKNTIKINQ